MTLKAGFGAASEAGLCERNGDFFGMVVPGEDLLVSKGITAAIADGVGEIAGREAAEYAVLSVLSDYYDTPETWEVTHALGKLFSSTNRWLLSHGATRREFPTMATTLSLLVLRGARYTIAHVGDTRIYRLRGKDLSLLTRDHVWQGADGRHVLKRAVGLDLHLVVDYEEGELKQGDVFLLASDGVWEALGEERMSGILQDCPDPEKAASRLVAEALESGSEGNATAQVIRVDEVSKASLLDYLGRDLPAPPALMRGQRLDGYCVLDLVHESESRIVYKVKEEATGRILAMKAPKQAEEGFLVEEWILSRISSSFVPKIVVPERRHFQYILSAWQEGSTLLDMMQSGHHFSFAEVEKIASMLARAVSSLERLGIVHTGISPENLHMGDDGKLRLLGFGAACCPSAGIPGTDLPNDPVATEIHAMGWSLYEILTGKSPYEDGRADPAPPGKYRPDVPDWFGNILVKCVLREPARRFEMPEEMLVALEAGEKAIVPVQARTPLAQRNPLATWRFTAAVSIFVNLYLIYLRMLESIEASSGSPW